MPQDNTASDGTIRVLQSARRPRAHTNPFITQLMASANPAQVKMIPFTWRGAIFGRYDLVHLHWPEYLVRGENVAIRVIARALFAVFLARIRILRIPIIQTVHNKDAHETGSARERRLLTKLTDRVSARIFMVPDGDMGPTDFFIPHGHYRDWFAEIESSPVVPGRIAFVGIVRPYKGLDELIRAFAGLSGKYSLTISGRALSQGYEAVLRELASSDRRVSLDIRHIDDVELVNRVTSAALIVLPYRDVYNSGALLLALSLGRRVLVRSSPTVDALAREVGPGWIETFDGPLSPKDLELAISRRPQRADERPNLDRRDWQGIAESHRAAYTAVLRRRSIGTN
ncbi:glycosyltransferase [Microbacterium sp. CFH 90308]|uniref:Glycosyltransferase n=1 Tax=Microbacterium salsuginis TaxID=2722803 RepID=A0ABX1KE15_9MICO|nr:glycosyltransferase [Microbacterium sp. CFH 90308]NLP84324.1 glycosyltransferase [Microbacterium sp. CFH 90308]